VKTTHTPIEQNNAGAVAYIVERKPSLGIVVGGQSIFLNGEYVTGASAGMRRRNADNEVTQSFATV
jgi:hypothetical protein